MPRHTSTSRTALTAPSLNLLPASLIHFHDSNNNSSHSGKAAVLRRRQILKHIPQIQTTHVDADDTASADADSPTSLIASNLGNFGAKVGSSLPVVCGAIPALAFINTLRTSVALSASLHPPSNPASAPPSPCLFPQLSPSAPSATSISRRLTASMASGTSDASVAGPAPLPALDFVPVTTETERTEGLKLVADSVAQRRQLASYALMTHPYFLGLMGAAFTGVYQYMYKTPSDWALIMTTSIGVLMAGFVTIRAAVSKYIDLAESINYKWLDHDEMVIARWGSGEDQKVIGSLVYKIEKASGSGNGRKGKKIATVRAWTTRQRMRGNGVGKGLVEEAVKQAKKKGVDDVRWDEGNIYETRVLPKWANGGFQEGLKEARRKLESYVTEFHDKK